MVSIRWHLGFLKGQGLLVGMFILQHSYENLEFWAQVQIALQEGWG